MMTVGPWRPISLDTYTYRFEDVRVDTDLLGPDYTVGTLKADIQLGPCALPSGSSIKAVLRDSSGTSIKEDVVSNNKLDWRMDQGEIAGWYPINYGKQPLYKLELTVIDSVSGSGSCRITADIAGRQGATIFHYASSLPPCSSRSGATHRPGRDELPL
jgi:beta-mannosidase